MVLLPFRTVLPQTENGLVLYLTGNAGAGKIMHDCSPMGNNGRIHGATWTQGKFGKALSFDGVDDYVEIPDSASLDITDAITIAVWFKLKQLDENQRLVRKGIGTPSSGYAVRVENTNKVRYFFYDEGGNLRSIFGTTTLAIDVWYFAVMTYDGTTLKGYLNGNLENSLDVTTTIKPNDYPLTIGSDSASTHVFNGTIDEVRIYNRALSEEEIRAHFKGAVIKLKAGLSAPVRIRGAMILRKPVR